MARELRATLLGLAGGSGCDYDGTQAVLEQLSSSVLDGPQLQRSTYGPRVAQTARLLGLELMPWQQFVADVALEVDLSTGLLAYREVVLTVPRLFRKRS